MALRLLATQPRPSLAVYDRTGATKRANLQPRGFTWQHELSQPGSVTFRLPLDDPAIGDLTDGAIVKAFWRGVSPIGARIPAADTTLAVDGKPYRQWQNMPGLLDVWADLIVLPEYVAYPEFGLRATPGTQRMFGPMAIRGHWWDSGNWTLANGIRYLDDTGLKRHKPGGLKSTNPMWISKVGPYHSMPPRSTLWFWRSFNTAAEIAAQVLAAGDDLMTLYLDGQQIFTPDQQDHQSWNYLAVIKATIPAGPHVLAAKIQNSSVDGSENPVSFIAAIQQLDNKGNPVKGDPVLVTDESWWVSSVHPTWNAGEMISRVLQEGIGQGVDAATILDRGFTDVHEHDGGEWTAGREYTFDIGSTLLDMAQTLCAHGLDLDANPATMTVPGYQRKGSDLSGSVQVQTGRNVGGSLIDYQVARVWPRYNSALIQKRDGTWQVREDSASVDDWGKAQIGLALGSTVDDDTVAEVATIQFDQTAKSTFQFVIELSTLIGPQPYRDFQLGDTISIPNESDTGYMKGRVIAITVDASGETVRQWIECREDTSV